MKSLRLAVGTLSLFAFLFAGVQGLQAQATPEATVRGWMNSFNAGDMAATASVNAPSTSIIDEFPPYTWSGPNAFAEWAAGFDADSKARGVTEPKVVLGKLIVNSVTATQAYLIFPAVYTYKLKGVAMREPGQDAIAMRKEGGKWKVVSWAWVGTVPKPVK